MKKFHNAWPCAALIALSLGCGGGVGSLRGGGSGGGPTGGDSVGAPAEDSNVGTARVTVDLDKGKIQVTPLKGGSVAASGKVKAHAVFAGGSVKLDNAQILEDSGDVTIRRLKFTVTNQTNAAIGGGASGLRFTLGSFTTGVPMSTDLRSDVSVSTLAGSGMVGTADGAAAQATLGYPQGIWCDTDQSLYVSTYTSGVRRIKNGYVATVASGFGYLSGIAGDGTWIYAADNTKNCVRRMHKDGTQASIIAGSSAGTAGDTDGTAGVSQLKGPRGLGIDSAGNLWVVDSGNGKVKKISNPGGAATTKTVVTGLTTPYGLAVGQLAEGGGFQERIAITDTGVKGVFVIDPVSGSKSLITASPTTSVQTGYGSKISFPAVSGIAISRGMLFVGDTNVHQIFALKQLDGSAASSPTSWFSAVVAGQASTFADGPGNAAGIVTPLQIGIESDGALAVADMGSQRVRRVTVPYNGFNSGSGGSSGDVSVSNSDGILPTTQGNQPYFILGSPLAPGASADLKPFDFALGPNVRQFSFVVTVDGSTDYSTVLDAVLSPGNTPVGSPNVLVRTWVGTPNSFIPVDGTTSTAKIVPGSVCAAADGTVFLSNYVAIGDGSAYIGKSITRIDPDGTVSTILGSGKNTSGNPVDGNGNNAVFGWVKGLACTPDGKALFIADNYSLRRASLIGADPRVAPNWTVHTIAGSLSSQGEVSGLGSVARFQGLAGVATDAKGTLVALADRAASNVRICAFTRGNSPDDPDAWMCNVAAGPTDGSPGDTDSSTTASKFRAPSTVAIGPDSTIYVGEDIGNRIRKVVIFGNVSTIAGSTTAMYGFKDGIGTNALLGSPRIFGIHPAGYLYIGDTGNMALRRLSLQSGEVRTVVGGGNAADGPGDKAKLVSSYAGALVANGDLVFADGSTLRVAQHIVGGQ